MSSGFAFGLRAHDYGRHAPADLAARLALTGASHVQLAPSKALIGFEAAVGSLSAAAAADIARAFGAAGLRISVLGCYVDLLAGDGRAIPEAEARFLESLERAGALEAGYVATESFGSRPGMHTGPCQLPFLKAFEALVHHAERIGVNIAVEPVFSHRVSSARAMASMFADLGSERLFCLLDPVNLMDPDEPAKALEGALACVELFSGRIAALHLKDYLPGRGKLAVAPPGRGLFPYAAFFKRAAALGLSCDLIVEDCAPEALSSSISFLEGEGAGLVAARQSREGI
ncbi:MAG TPA: hypothetical protein DCG47_01220 [Spirochaetaceae bacterium]|nr:hypothetical protein [Spirochaetaceae bacterium]